MTAEPVFALEQTRHLTPEVADLYFCPTEPTVAARWSSNEPDYTSGLAFAINRYVKGRMAVALVQAYIRACVRGLISAKQHVHCTRAS
jgi:hypothetical protein